MNDTVKQWAIIIPGKGIETSPNYKTEADVWSLQDYSKEFLIAMGYKAALVEIKIVI